MVNTITNIFDNTYENYEFNAKIYDFNKNNLISSSNSSIETAKDKSN